MLCARCHTHPLENWTQADYYGLASFFNQVSTRPDGRFPNVPNAKLVQLNLAAGYADQPAHRPAAAAASSSAASEPKLAAGADRREAYASWLTSPKNPFFARGLVNRFWSYFFHRGIIDPVDDIRSTNPPINPALLDALTKDFVEHKFDVAAPDAADRHLGDLPAEQRADAVEPARRAELLARHPAARPGRGAARFAGAGDRRAGELRRRPGRLPRRPAARRQRRRAPS